MFILWNLRNTAVSFNENPQNHNAILEVDIHINTFISEEHIKVFVITVDS